MYVRLVETRTYILNVLNASAKFGLAGAGVCTGFILSRISPKSNHQGPTVQSLRVLRLSGMVRRH